MVDLKGSIQTCIENNRELIAELNRYLHSNPELGFEERKAEAKLSEVLAAKGFQVTRAAGGMETAFTATKEFGGSGPHLAFLAEYDALPELGHACGHNLIALVAVAAGLGLTESIQGFQGKISIFGTPAEEVLINSGKMQMIDQGLFDDVDLVLMAHPAHHTWIADPFLAANKIVFSFKGRPAHAAGGPYQGINAYDAVQLTFTGLNFLRQQFRQDARVHWGEINVPAAMNVIPDFASATIGVRATDNEYTAELTQKAINCIKGAALMTGCEAEYELVPGYQAIKVNPPLVGILEEKLGDLGIEVEPPSPFGQAGSTDAGNVSQVVPSAHPLYKIADAAPHTVEFCQAAGTEEAFEISLKVALALALTGAECLLDPDKLAQVRAAFKS